MKMMLKTAVVILGAAICGSIHAADSGNAAENELAEINKKIAAMLETAPKGPHGGKLISPELKELMDRRSGGLVYPKTNGKALLIVDARGGEYDGFVDEFAKDLKRNFHLHVATSRKTVAHDADPFAAANAFKTDANPAVILITDTESRPTLAIYPEDAVGVVNATRLKDADAAKYKVRLAKEVWGDDTPAQCNAIYESVSAIGLQAAKPVSYKMACRQGWAPAPTNSIQKAIWDEVHAVPATPMKIEFDPKKGR